MRKILLSMAVLGSVVASDLPNFEITPSVGSMTSSSDTNLKSRLNYGIGFGSKLSDDLMLNLLYFRANNRPYKDGLNRTSVNTFILNPEYYLKDEGKYLPYISAGLGFETFGNEMYGNEDSVLFNYGVGIRYILNPKTHLKLEAKHLIDEDKSNNFLYTAGIAIPFGEASKPAPKDMDSDGDGVFDSIDKCPDTLKGVEVDGSGCPLDSDGDGVADYLDKCPDTPKGAKVDERGCPFDADSDGVIDELDKCPDTPKGVSVNESGCPLDSDGDGVADYLDKCPDTPKGVSVNESGCPLDSDEDGVADYLDKCPNTPQGFRVNSDGCKVSFMFNVTFEYDSAKLKDTSLTSINEFTKFLNENPKYNVEIQGHTDEVGSEKYNQKLSERRASAVYDKLIELGIDKNRLSVKGYGELVPIADNATKEGRAKNRRVEGKLIVE